MARVYRLYVGILTALALCKYCLAEWNATNESANRTVPHCRHHGSGDNCTGRYGQVLKGQFLHFDCVVHDSLDTDSWNRHFSECPEELKHYCVHGECRYVEEQKAPSCRCHVGYIGSRCEYVDLDWRRGEKRQLIIVCIIAVLVVLILVIVLICICSHRRCRLCYRRGRRRDGEPRNGTEKLSMMDTSAAHTTLTPDSTDPPHTNAV